MKKFITISYILLSLVLPAKASAEERFSINFRNTALSDALQLIAGKGHLQLKMPKDLEGRVNYSIRNSTLADALDSIATSNEIDYQIRGGFLVIAKKKSDSTTAPASLSTSGPATNVDTRHPASLNPASPYEKPGQGLTYRSVPVMYASARDLSQQLQKNLINGETIVSDDSNNVLLLFSTLGTYEQVKTFINLYDRRPSQILIEAEIVETTKSFARDLGVSWGDMNPTVGDPSTGGIINPSQPNPNLVLRGLLGSINGRLLEARLLAAESRGEAKIVSRPKVFALNNKKATIHSGLTYNVKTLSAVTTGGSSASSGSSNSSPSAVTGGIVSITSGLELDVTPTVVGDGLVRLVVKVTNSEPDVGSGVDGIPGLNDNSAETSVLVRGGDTATMAGLIKNSNSKNQSGVPWLSHIPVLGWLFSSNQKSEATSELMIFLTPHIIEVNAPDRVAETAALSPAPAAVVSAPIAAPATAPATAPAGNAAAPSVPVSK
jgi:type IV pilus assembly protein PilQ